MNFGHSLISDQGAGFRFARFSLVSQLESRAWRVATPGIAFRLLAQAPDLVLALKAGLVVLGEGRIAGDLLGGICLLEIESKGS